MEKLSQRLLECAVASRTLPGEPKSGDQHLIQPFSNGVLVAVVDGLGHGAEASEAASIAVSTLQKYAHESVDWLIERCQERLRHGRGVVASIASFNTDSSTMSWIGIGNVTGLLIQAQTGKRHMLLLRAGVVGGALPTLRASTLHLCRGDTLIFATDGVESEFADDLTIDNSPQKMADRILAAHVKQKDDAMVLVARFLGESA